VVNALMIELAAAIVPGFQVASFAAAFWGGIVLSILNVLINWVLPGRDQR
jgi:uncharacterized membrane protein YvlD (DUF360 family)